MNSRFHCLEQRRHKDHNDVVCNRYCQIHCLKQRRHKDHTDVVCEGYSKNFHCLEFSRNKDHIDVVRLSTTLLICYFSHYWKGQKNPRTLPESKGKKSGMHQQISVTNKISRWLFRTFLLWTQVIIFVFFCHFPLMESNQRSSPVDASARIEKKRPNNFQRIKIWFCYFFQSAFFRPLSNH